MPVIAILIGLVAGLAVWVVLDQVQSRAVERIFGRELSMRLDLRARESLIRFDQYMTNYAATTRLLANHRRLAQYLEPLFWFPGEEVDPIVYDEFRPFWLPDFFGRNALLAPSHVLLVDSRGQVREVYQAGDAPLPPELQGNVAQWLGAGDDMQTVLARFGDRPYLVVSDQVEDAGGYTMGSLLVVVPVDADFLTASEGSFSADRSAVALVDADEQRILASNEPQRLMPGTALSEWTDTYLVTSQSLPAYEGSNWNMLFTTFIPQQIVAKMSGKVVDFERNQRLIAALVFIAVFTLVIYLVSARLNKVLKRMTRFSQRALGIEQPGFQRGGNQLVLLEEWMQHFTSLVLRAREEMRRKHEHEMRETEALKAAIMEASLDSIVTLNRAGSVIDYNPTAERTLGFDRQTIIGTDFVRAHVSPTHRAIFVGLLQESNRRGNLGERPHARTELEAIRADGQVFPIEVSIVPIELDNERVYTLYIHDITKRKETEREIKGLARFASESPSPILRVNGAARIVYANAASQPLIAAWQTRLGGPLPERWCGQVRRALQDGGTYEEDDDLGATIYSLLFVPIQELGYVNIYARDITAVRRAEQESRQHQAELVHVCRLSTMGEVATGMAHELNQPLSAIVNYANGASRRLKSGSGDNETLVDAMTHISGQARRAGEIIKRLRALVGKQQPIRSVVDLNYLVREVCGFVEFETAKLEMQIEQRLWAEPIPVDVDLVQIEQVLLNLVRNALDALEECPVGGRSLVISTRRTDGRAMVGVRDNGPGIPAERMDQLFDPFFTTKESGMGMGLPISLTILEDHQGTIRAESELGVGTLFHVELPVAVSEAVAGQQGAPEAQPVTAEAPVRTERRMAEGMHG
ncbi:PAS domain-containing sensor histidine kinase [Halochromatium glycolicum]|uniref:histidine kinase n=2 Tax=Halochromatium glycolicum TaxID=85075 RepID=A0AAJ0U8I0_9GAMM|nr:ATP-binding protein [Halochromatium glycolicum]MBK1707158.1 PAS domain-containing sensor histidine kinase [Halochromatium glycolicum]